MKKLFKANKKVKKLIKKDIWVSVAITSLLVNVFFLTGVIMFTSTNSLDESLFNTAHSNLCDKNYIENLSERMEEGDNPELERLAFEVKCRAGGFETYFDNAIEAFVSDSDL